MSSEEITKIFQGMLSEIKDELKDIKKEFKDVKEELNAIKEKQEATAIDVAVLETMQKAIEGLELDKRLRKVETKQATQETKENTGVSMVAWLVPTALSVLGLIIAILTYLYKH